MALLSWLLVIHCLTREPGTRGHTHETKVSSTCIGCLFCKTLPCQALSTRRRIIDYLAVCELCNSWMNLKRNASAKKELWLTSILMLVPNGCRCVTEHWCSRYPDEINYLRAIVGLKVLQSVVDSPQQACLIKLPRCNWFNGNISVAIWVTSNALPY